ncbi:MAG: hypothetical protein GXO02_03890, partial [Epsilonproteobacteria bacterium]|nr:hypothetical protein [Campylobacterota bacterium]
MRLFSYIFGVLLIIPLFGTTVENSSINCIKSDKDIFAIYKLDNKTMAIGGDFTKVNLKKRSKIALIEPNSCKLLDKFSNFKIENKSNPSNSFIRAIERYKDYLIIGGVFSSIDDGDGIQKCDGLAIIDLKSQKLFWCYEGIDIKDAHGVFSLSVDRKNKILYVGGDFREPKRALLAFDISSLDKDESNIVYLDAP